MAQLKQQLVKQLIGVGVLILLLWKSTSGDRGQVTRKLDGKVQKRKSRLQGKGNVDHIFFKKIRELIKIVIPRWNCKESKYLALLTMMLVLRTQMSIWLSDVNGSIVKAIVEMNFKKFIKRIMGLMLFAIPSSAVNSGMDYFTKLLAISFRERITRHFHDQYLQNMYYYKITNLDSRIQNPDQRLTADADKWGQSLAGLYLNVTKPLLDIVMFSNKLSQHVGWEGPGLVVGWYLFSGLILKLISPSFGRLTAIEQTIEGEYRAKHSDLLQHSEEVAFYNGSEWEKERINDKFKELMNHRKFVLHKKFLMGIFESMLVKYGAFMVGYAVVGLPVFGPNREAYLKKIKNDPKIIMNDYVRNTGLLINLAKAIGKLIISYKDVQNLAGYTTLIHEMDEVLRDFRKGKFQRTQVITQENGETKEMPMQMMDLKNKGKITEANSIVFKDIPLISPAGDELISSMSFDIQPGMHTMIVGPNGCGKSALFRILAELWPCNGGSMNRPNEDSIFYIPQRVYLPAGNLRDQLIYPHTLSQFKELGHTEQMLEEILSQVHLAYILKREGSWDKHNDWTDVLSGGEKQRMAIGRLIYHKPKFAMLDECTSAVSKDVEGHLYTYMKQQGITLITVSHRDTLHQYHEYILKFKGDKEYEFGKMPIKLN